MGVGKLPALGRLPKGSPAFMAAAAGVGFILLAVVQGGQIQRVRQQLALSQQHIAQLESQNQDLGQQLAAVETERQEVEGRLASLRNQLATSTTDLEASRGALKDLQDRYEQVADERTQLQAQVAAVTGERDDTKERLERTEQDAKELERAVGRLRERLAFLDRDYRALATKLAEAETRPSSSLSVISSIGPTSSAIASSSTTRSAPSSVAGSVELPPIVVRKDQAGISVPVRGRILEVNEAHHFVVVDKGSQDGVRVGMTFDFLRGSATVGRAKVVRVRPQLSACDILRAETPGPIQAGDQAVQSGS